MDALTVEGLPALSAKSFAQLADYIYGELGIQMPASKLATLQGRLYRRLRELGLHSMEEYREYLFSSLNGQERQQFINAVTTNKTDFFREPQHFEFLKRTALPELTSRERLDSRGQVKLWSAGCSSGEEAYTLAMVLSEYACGHPGFDYVILGTDVSTRVLDQARNGIYDETHIAPVPLEFRRKYLLRSRDKAQALFRIVPELRARVSFHQLNFMGDDYCMADLFHIVFFRNVLIYFDRKTQETVVNRICRNLAPSGYLMVGHSESLTGLDVPLKLVRTSVFQRTR